MPELIAKDSDGNEHMIWIQERPFSCGLACAYMLERHTKRMSIQDGEGRLRNLSKLFPAGFKDGYGISNTKVIADVLRLVGVNAEFTNKLPTKFPFVTNIRWSNGGGHFVVVARKNKSGGFVFLDPIYGLVEHSVVDLQTSGYKVSSNVREQRSEAASTAKFTGFHVLVP